MKTHSRRRAGAVKSSQIGLHCEDLFVACLSTPSHLVNTSLGSLHRTLITKEDQRNMVTESTVSAAGDPLHDVEEITLPHRIPEAVAQRIASSTREATEQSSDASIHAANESEQWNLLHNCRVRRRGNIPGWFDRWKLGFPSWTPLPRCIQYIADAPVKAYYRRRLMLGFALQMTTITAGTSALLFVPRLEKAAKTSFLSNSDLTIGLFVAMIGIIPVLKLVFDVVALRRVIFAAHTTLILLGTTSTAITKGLSEVDAASVAIVLGAITLETWIQWFLSGIQICGHFLEPFIVFGIPAFLLPIVTVGLASTLGDESGFSLVVQVLHSMTFGTYKSLSIALLLDTVEPEDASLGVYFFTFDLLPGFLWFPLRMCWEVTLLIIFLGFWGCQLIYRDLCCCCSAVDCNLRARPQPSRAVHPVAPVTSQSMERS